MRKAKEKLKYQTGVTMMEMLVAVSLFAITVMTSMTIFQMVIKAQGNAIASNNIQSNMRYILEAMAKEIRMAKVSDHACETLFAGNTANYQIYNTDVNNEILYFENEDGYCMGYYIDSDRLKVRIDTGAAIRDGFITPDELEFKKLEVNIIDNMIIAPIRSVQPRVTIILEVSGKSGQIEEIIDVQTTISSRNYY